MNSRSFVLKQTYHRVLIERLKPFNERTVINGETTIQDELDSSRVQLVYVKLVLHVLVGHVWLDCYYIQLA